MTHRIGWSIATRNAVDDLSGLRSQWAGSAAVSKPRLHVVATVSHPFETYLAGQAKQLAENFEVTLVSAPSSGLFSAGRIEGARTHAVPMTRSISPARDLVALLRLFWLFRRDRPSLVQSYSPKAGLLAMTAATVARVPVRVHGIVGMPLMEATGVRAQVLRWTESLTYALATHLTCNSVVLRDWIRANLTRRRISVIGNGSINGVDTERLRPPTTVEREQARQQLGLQPRSCVFAFVGRLVEDKGVVELIDAFTALRPGDPVQLLLVGDQEDESLPTRLLRQMESDPRIVRIGWRRDVRPAYWAADVVVLPSYREGLPNVLLEASAVGLPLVATNINGCNEVVRQGENGLLVPVRDVDALAAALEQMRDSRCRREMGSRGRERVVRDFDHRAFCAQLLDRYTGWATR